MKNSYRIILILLCISPQLYSQQVELTGKVYAFETIPLKNVEVKVKESDKNVKTDSRDLFITKCNQKDDLLIKAFGFNSIKINSSPKEPYAPLHINLKFKEKKRIIEVTNGYYYIDNDKLKYSISHLNDKNTTIQFYGNILKITERRLFVMTIQQNNSVIGEEQTQFKNNYPI
ncbi:MAG: hypothetical protein GXO47_07495 [Chlorobi bacterium]|nr:hypothetical protein [Chlorobiota bacterium]